MDCFYYDGKRRKNQNERDRFTFLNGTPNQIDTEQLVEGITHKYGDLLRNQITSLRDKGSKMKKIKGTSKMNKHAGGTLISCPEQSYPILGGSRSKTTLNNSRRHSKDKKEGFVKVRPSNESCGKRAGAMGNNSWSRLLCQPQRAEGRTAGEMTCTEPSKDNPATSTLKNACPPKLLSPCVDDENLTSRNQLTTAKYPPTEWILDTSNSTPTHHERFVHCRIINALLGTWRMVLLLLTILLFLVAAIVFHYSCDWFGKRCPCKEHMSVRYVPY